MPDDLRTRLAKSKIESQQRYTSPWAPGVWAAAAAAYKSGWTMPETRYPILISPDSPISSPEKLQQLADLPLLPELTTAIKTEMYDDSNPEEVQICDINWDQYLRLQDLTEGEDIIVWFQDTKRACWVAQSIKKKDTPKVE